jgi:hypothetical protein
MKCRSVAWAAVLLSCLLMVFHGKSTRGNTSTNQEQTSQSAPQSTAAPATGDTEKISATFQVTLAKKREAPSRTVNGQEGQFAPASPLHPLALVLSAGAVGAAAGVLVGDLASGGRGALIGSAIGAGDGITGSAFTGNNDLVVPPESLTSIQAGASIEA